METSRWGHTREEGARRSEKKMPQVTVGRGRVMLVGETANGSRGNTKGRGRIPMFRPWWCQARRDDVGDVWRGQVRTRAVSALAGLGVRRGDDCSARWVGGRRKQSSTAAQRIFQSTSAASAWVAVVEALGGFGATVLGPLTSAGQSSERTMASSTTFTTVAGASWDGDESRRAGKLSWPVTCGEDPR